LGPAELGALGGAMVPIEVFPEAMRTIAHVTPHAWAMDAFRALLFDDATLADIVPQLGVLVLFAIGLVTVAVLRFRQLLRTGAI